MVAFNGSLVDFSSFIPGLITLSSAEAEINTLAVATAAAMHIQMIVMWLLRNDVECMYTIPIFCDSSAAIIITTNERPSRRTRHIKRRWLYPRHAYASGKAVYKHVNGDELMLADPLTKNKSIRDEDVAFKYSMFLSDPPNAISSSSPHRVTMTTSLKRGDGSRVTLPISKPTVHDSSTHAEVPSENVANLRGKDNKPVSSDATASDDSDVIAAHRHNRRVSRAVVTNYGFTQSRASQAGCTPDQEAIGPCSSRLGGTRPRPQRSPSW